MAKNNLTDNQVNVSKQINSKDLVYLKTLLNTKDAATYLCVSVPWMERQRWLGTGPAVVRIGRSCRYRISDLEAYINQNKTAAPAV
jgi:predicted DNA-binding transcriptional regulator AlpA